MSRTSSKILKFINLIKSYTIGYFQPTLTFVRIIPSDRCNLNCEYCWQKNNESSEMTLSDFNNYLKKAKKFNVGIITFLGGEPMLWEHIYHAISECSKSHILTDMTTNGTCLTRKTITQLGKSGLDYLNISVDGFKNSVVSKKNSAIDKKIVELLKAARSKYRMHLRINSVIYKNNFNDLKKLIEFSKFHNIPISLGFVVPPLEDGKETDSSIYFHKEDETLLMEIVSYVLHKKRKGYPIIDPNAYFENIFSFMNREDFWDCNYPTRHGWVNVVSGGKLRSCTKKMDELEYDFLDLNPEKIKRLKEVLRTKVKKCNINCYSNCAYSSYYYVHHKLQLLKAF